VCSLSKDGRVAILWSKGWISVDVGHGVGEENFVASSFIGVDDDNRREILTQDDGRFLAVGGRDDWVRIFDIARHPLLLPPHHIN
jgi:hypothetical protein